MNVDDLVRLMDGPRTGQTATVLSLSPLYAELRLTSTGEIVTVPRADLVYVDPAPQTTAQWRLEHMPWRKRNARVIQRLMEWREGRGLAA